MKIYIQKCDFRGVEGEFKRIMKPDREYVVILQETIRSKAKRKKANCKSKT